jgi:hypothetical protein
MGPSEGLALSPTVVARVMSPALKPAGTREAEHMLLIPKPFTAARSQAPAPRVGRRPVAFRSRSMWREASARQSVRS